MLALLPALLPALLLVTPVSDALMGRGRGEGWNGHLCAGMKQQAQRG